ncbi:hypothetical protein MKC74_03930 [[Clostridium] innocuum]|uniref:hypothetical protein n=1 Tax=Clostridium TaxID=1485 RepID=UPI002148274F|nr:hypothetical protein [[Clostridium] innocuum]MCR0407691.1 hypothetical protein [[Clostridium] innocuum]MCR0546768.1 hypothetical protein [[Clostridium] innocuum]
MNEKFIDDVLNILESVIAACDLPIKILYQINTDHTVENIRFVDAEDKEISRYDVLTEVENTIDDDGFITLDQLQQLQKLADIWNIQSDDLKPLFSALIAVLEDDDEKSIIETH